ncbi:hypothetical protein AB0J83_44860 [Actinoplanes sp. NPDC049596]|uniref:hypothetical protein n=1 Tax=unclassified Actinoplanes TaxID=2626549 RepID=UPI003418DDE4
MRAALLITGTVGVGKTATAEAVGELLAEEQVAHAVVDVDWLRRSWPAPPGDRFNGAIAVRNLRSVAANFFAAGAHRLILAGVIESHAERDEYQAAVGVPLTVCRLTLAAGANRERLARRHTGDPEPLGWHLARAPELAAVLDRTGVEDFTVDSGQGPVREIARAVLSGWL